jgi:sugar lactone lactonase YvrE
MLSLPPVYLPDAIWSALNNIVVQVNKLKISMLSQHRCHLGEGPLWDPIDEALYWVDSFGPRLYRNDFASGKTRSWNLPGQTVGSLAVREQGGLILAMDQGFYAFDLASGQTELIAQPLAGRDDLRLNDGKVDPFGSFVAGAMNIDYTQSENCSMYRLSAELEVSEILDGFTCFNGPCFSAGGECLYVSGREEAVIEVFEYGNTQTPRNGRVLLDNCNPDGATVDEEGFIWSAQWDDHCVLRISPQGSIDRRLEFPGQVVSSVMFGGPQLDLLYVTTTGDEVQGVTPDADLPGRVLVVAKTGFRGRVEPFFRG